MRFLRKIRVILADGAKKLVNRLIVCLACLGDRFGTVVKYFTDTKNRVWHQRKLYSDTYGRLLLLSMEQVAGNVRAFVEYCTVEELVFRPGANVLKVVQTTKQGENQKAVERCYFRNVTESFGEMQDCHGRRVELEWEVKL